MGAVSGADRPYEAFFDMNELADRKTRFALVMMGALNALNLVLGTQRMFGDLTAGIRPLIGVYFTLYAALSLYFFVHAIATLRPRISMFPSGQPAAAARAGLRFIGDVVTAAEGAVALPAMGQHSGRRAMPRNRTARPGRRPGHGREVQGARARL